MTLPDRAIARSRRSAKVSPDCRPLIVWSSARPPTSGRSRSARRPNGALKANSERRQQPLHNCCKTNESYKNFKQISEPPIAHKSVDQVKANCADNDDDQYVYEQEKHVLSPIVSVG